MTISEFNAAYNSPSFQINKELKIRQYLPIADKIRIADDIIAQCTTEEHGCVKVDSVKQSVLFAEAMIREHTCLDIVDGSYDALMESKAFYVISECFAADLKGCQEVLRMRLNDKMRDSSLDGLMCRVVNGIEGMIDVATKKLDGFTLQSLFESENALSYISQIAAFVMSDKYANN